MLLYAVNICWQQNKTDALRLRVISLLIISDIDEGIFIQFNSFLNVAWRTIMFHQLKKAEV